MIEFFVKRPVTAVMFASLFVVLGIVSYFNINMEKTPKIDFPLVTVSLLYPGATPQEMESMVVNKVEDVLSEISEVKKIQSQSFENFAFVIVEFLLSADSNAKLIEVKDKIESLTNQLPENMKKPIVQNFDPFVQPVTELVVNSDSFNEDQLYDYADQSLKESFLTLKGVANVEVVGGRKRRINVRLDPMLMKENYISLEDVVGTVQAKNKNVPAGVIEGSEFVQNIKFIGEYDKVEEIAETSLITRNGEIIPLSKIAAIEDGFVKNEKISRYNGKNVISLLIKKSSDSNAVKVAKRIKEKMRRLNLSSGPVSLETAVDNTDLIEKENHQTEKDILLGIAFTVMILFLFTGNFKLTLVAFLTIPLSIISAFFLMDKFQFSLNFLTLLAIGTSLGTLISNTIVIVDSFWSHLKKGKDSFHAAIDGTKEVAVAILASTGTNLVVFLPIAFMQGMIGQFFYSFGLTVIFVTVFSLMISFMITPMFCCRFLKNVKKKSFVPLAKPLHFFFKGYEKLYKKIFSFPKTTFIAVLLMIFSVKFILPYIAGDFMPKSDESKIVIKVSAPQGSSQDYTLRLTKEIENRIKVLPEMQSFSSVIGNYGSENSLITLRLTDSSERKRKDTEIIDDLIPALSQIPDADIHLIRGTTKGFDDGDITLGVYGKNEKEMIQAAQNLQEKMVKSGYFRSVESSYRSPKKELCFIPDPKALLENGLRDAQVGSAIRSAIYGDESNLYKENGREYVISIKLDDRYMSHFEDMQHISLITRKGLVPMTHLGSLKKRDSLPKIIHENKERVIKLNGFLAKSNPGHVKKELMQTAKTPKEGIRYGFGGMDETQKEASREIVKAFILAVILTYMLLAAILNSLSHPLSILVSIATSFVGVFYALFYLEGSINISSMLGMVMLVGLVVNNSILLVDAALHKRKMNIPLKQALWEATSERFQMILMTSFAVVLGILPQLFAEMDVKSSMGAVMIGGILASIVFTFILTPLLFYLIERIKEKSASLFK